MKIPDNAVPGSAKRSSRLANLTLAAVTTVVVVAALEVALRVLDLSPPTYNYGDSDVGWLSALGTGERVTQTCADLESGTILRFDRNEDGVRTSHSSLELRTGTLPRIAVGGDSHTDLCAGNEETHFGYLEQSLGESGVPARVYAFGAGKYSPLQAYLAVRPTLTAYSADVFVLNLYTGNDFMDLLRIDDRPHFVRDGDRYRIAPPVWYQQDPPGVTRRSHLLALLRRFGAATGVSRLAVRVAYLYDAAADQGKGIRDVVGYMNDLRKSSSSSVGYPQAFTAQMLNQQIFFQRFDGTRDESVVRLRHLLRLIREENPDRLLVLSPIPSFQLVHPEPVDTALDAVLTRLPLTYSGGVEEEAALHAAAREIALETGWTFVDNVPALREASTTTKLYNTYDYHIEPVASEIIGRNEARAVAPWLAANARAARRTTTPTP